MQAIDFRLFQLVNQFAGKWSVLDSLMTAITNFGPFLLLLPLVYFWFYGEDEGRQTVILTGVAVAGALLVNQVIGHIYFRPRPFAAHKVALLVPRSLDPSFPSDHATFAFAIASTVWLRHRHLGIIVIGLAALIAISRVFVGMHYPLDVIGSATIGMCSALVTWRMRSRLAFLTSFVVGVAKRIRLA